MHPKDRERDPAKLMNLGIQVANIPYLKYL